MATVAGMPATFPAHSAAVLPLKMRWPRAFDGVALMVGATAPDQAYALYGWARIPATHQWNGLLWFVLPMTLWESWAARRAAPIVAAHLAAIRRPAWLGRLLDTLAVGDYGAIATSRHRWYITVSSALVGGATHLAWDGLAHEPGVTGFANNLLPFLDTPAINGLWWWRYSESICTIVGTVLAGWMLTTIGRRRLVREWHGPAPTPRLRPQLFWTCVAVGVMTYLATLPLLEYKTTAPVQGVRLLWTMSLGFLAGGAVVGWWNRLAPTSRSSRTHCRESLRSSNTRSRTSASRPADSSLD